MKLMKWGGVGLMLACAMASDANAGIIFHRRGRCCAPPCGTQSGTARSTRSTAELEAEIQQLRNVINNHETRLQQLEPRAAP